MGGDLTWLTSILLSCGLGKGQLRESGHLTHTHTHTHTDTHTHTLTHTLTHSHTDTHTHTQTHTTSKGGCVGAIADASPCQHTQTHTAATDSSFLASPQAPRGGGDHSASRPR